MTQAEFVGVPMQATQASGTAFPFATLYSGFSALLQPDLSNPEPLTGYNAGFVLYPTTNAPLDRVLFDASGQPAGFYSNTTLAVEDTLRKRWLAEELIMATWNARHVQLTTNMQRNLTATSEKSFRRAHEIAVRRAHANLENVPTHVRANYNLNKLV